MRRKLEALGLSLLLVGAVVNLTAGVRRPLRERAILGSDHYAHADAAAAAVRRHLPADHPLAVVVYDGDVVGELDVGVWFDYRSRWLLYPREVALSRVAPNDPLELRQEPGKPPPRPGQPPDYLEREYVLFFRATDAPTLPARGFVPLAADPMWVLARRSPRGAGAGD